MSRLFLALAATGLMALPAVADDLRDAAEAVTACRALPDADKAACFDTTSAALADLLAPAIVAAAPEDSAPEWAKAPEPKEPEVEKPRKARVEEPKQPNKFEVTIVRVGNFGGKMTFYTDDGQIWHQTQQDAVSLPALPTTAKIKKRMTGNPVIQFPNLSKSYKVERIE